jgi:hypothetical protein
VLDGQYAGFPLLHHWRVLPLPARPIPAGELADWVARWDGSAAIRRRLEAINTAPAAVVLFLEHIPHTVNDWLRDHGSYPWIEQELRAGTSFLRSAGLVHFDAHFRNLLTDGRRVYFADFGLALHRDFALSPEERDFFQRHRDYDRAYTAGHLAWWLVSNLRGIPWWSASAHLRDESFADLPPGAAAIVTRNQQAAIIMADFFEALEKTDKTTPYPAEALHTALAV